MSVCLCQLHFSLSSSSSNSPAPFSIVHLSCCLSAFLFVCLSVCQSLSLLIYLYLTENRIPLFFLSPLYPGHFISFFPSSLSLPRYTPHTHTLSQELTKLTIINLSCNQFSHFPREAFMSKPLVEVDLSTNKVEQSFRKP